MTRTNPDAPCESGWHVRPGRVLIVDDDPLILASLGRVLREEHEVETSLGGDAAIERLRRGERFDLILCDVTMPRMSGLDLLETLERDFPEQVDAVVFMSGGVSEDDRARLAARSMGYVGRPVDARRLLELVLVRIGVRRRRARGRQAASLAAEPAVAETMTMMRASVGRRS